jgi:hypothetical protein
VEFFWLIFGGLSIVVIVGYNTHTHIYIYIAGWGASLEVLKHVRPVLAGYVWVNVVYG